MVYIIFIFISVDLVLNWLNLPKLRDSELERIAREYDLSSSWTENDINEKRTTPSEFKKPPTPLPRPPPAPVATQAERLSTQIAYHEKRKEIQTQRHTTDQHSTPLIDKPPVFNDKFSPIDKMAPTTRINTQILVPIKENSSFDNDKQSQIKRQKFDDTTLKFNSNKDEMCLSTLEDIQEDDLKF